MMGRAGAFGIQWVVVEGRTVLTGVAFVGRGQN